MNVCNVRNRQQYREVLAESKYQASRYAGSVKEGWEADVAFRWPQTLPSWCKKNMPKLSIRYLGSDRHPQTSFRCARFDGVTATELMVHEMEFKELYGMAYGSARAEQAFNCIRNGIQHQFRFDQSESVVTELGLHYFLDATDRDYALKAQNGNLDKFESLNNYLLSK